jgi:cell division protein FtsW
MAKRASIDKGLFIVTLILVAFGLVMVYSASAVVSGERNQAPYAFLLKQLVCALMGLGAMFAAMSVKYTRWRNPVLVFVSLGVTTILLGAVYFLGSSHGAHRWIRLGFFSLQPSELAKPVLILFLAWFLETRMKDINDWKKVLFPALFPAILFSGLILLQPDLGSVIVCFAIFFIMVYVVGLNWRNRLMLILPSLALGIVAVAGTAFRRQRILAWWNPDSSPLKTGYQIIQSLIAVGAGGVHGVGLMEGKQKLFYLPEAHTDYIFAVIGEELGLIGTVSLLLLFTIFCYRGMCVALSAKDNFARLLAVGITGMIGVQAFFNMSVVLNMVPSKGIPLPLISYGGSSLIVTLLSIGVLLNISQEAV